MWAGRIRPRGTPLRAGPSGLGARVFDGSRAAVAAAEYGPYARPTPLRRRDAPGLHRQALRRRVGVALLLPVLQRRAAALGDARPMEMVDGPNVYLYVAASPVNAVDRMGLYTTVGEWVSCTIGINSITINYCGISGLKRSYRRILRPLISEMLFVTTAAIVASIEAIGPLFGGNIVCDAAFLVCLTSMPTRVWSALG